ncbi:MAG: winged helix-turn-helix transcriptional regulator [Nitratireductor sp.]|nr:winged helix-turn-helix transcriptional regulator [Nitratireductor sp.]
MLDKVHDADPLFLDSIPDSSSQAHIVTIRLKRLMDAEIVRTLDANGGLKVAEWRVLFVLDRDDELSQKEVSEEIFMEQAQASRALRALQDKGLVHTERDTVDLRRWNFRLTPAGDKLFASVNPAMQARRRRIDGILSTEEMEAFKALATKLAKGLRQLNADDVGK